MQQLLKTITSDVAFTWLATQRRGQTGSGVNEQKAKEQSKKKQMPAAVQVKLL